MPKSSSGGGRIPGRQVCRSQFPNWGCHYSREVWDAGVINQNLRQMGEFSIHALCEDITRDTAVCVQASGGFPQRFGMMDTETVASFI